VSREELVKEWVSLYLREIQEALEKGGTREYQYAAQCAKCLAHLLSWLGLEKGD